MRKPIQVPTDVHKLLMERKMDAENKLFRITKQPQEISIGQLVGVFARTPLYPMTDREFRERFTKK